MEMTTSLIGTRTEGMVLAALLKMGKDVLLPFGNCARYDLAYDEGGQLVRVQCKTGKVSKGRVVYNTVSLQRDNSPKHYDDQIEFFGVYCPELDEVYLVPPGYAARGKGSLRVEPTTNNQRAGVVWAADFKIG